MIIKLFFAILNYENCWQRGLSMHLHRTAGAFPEHQPLSEQCPLLQVCVCVPTAPIVCALGWVKYREHISLLIILCVIVYVTTKKYIYILLFFTDIRLW